MARAVGWSARDAGAGSGDRVTLDPLLVDVSPWQVLPPTVWSRLAAAGPPWCGVGLKVSEGTKGYPDWFGAHWPAVRDAGGERYGVDWFRLGYHFWRRDVSVGQAHDFLFELERAGGLDIGDMIAVDVERCEANQDATAAEVVDGVSAWVETVRVETGRDVVLYAGAWLAELDVRDRMGCSWLWYPSYTATLTPATYERIGWTREELFAWQYAGLGGDGRVRAALADYPAETPVGRADISAVTLPGGVERVRQLLQGRATSVCAAGPAR